MGRHLLRRLAALALVLLMASASATAATLKGRWTIVISPAERASLTTNFTFGKGGKGKAGNALTGGAVAYRQGESGFSATWELAGPIIPQASIPGPATIVLRGVLETETRVRGDVTIITDQEDPSSPTGFVTLQGTFVGEKQP